MLLVRMLVVIVLVLKALIVMARILIVLILIVRVLILMILLRLMLVVRPLPLWRGGTARQSIRVGLADQPREFRKRIAFASARGSVIIASASALGTIWISIRHSMRSPSGGRTSARIDVVQARVSRRCMSRRPTTTGFSIIAFRPAPG